MSKSQRSQYYVWYLGWKECRGLSGQEFTEPIVRELLVRRRSEALPKLTLEVTKKELKVTQLVEKRKGKVDKVKYPAIPSRDVTFATQALYPDEDVVACIYLGYNARTQCAVHVHVYRCDSPDTAALLVDNLTALVQLPEHQTRVRKIEQELFEKGQVVLRPGNRPTFLPSRGGPGSAVGGSGGNRPSLARQNSSDSEGRHSGGRAPSELSRNNSQRSSAGDEARMTSSFDSDAGAVSPRSPQSPSDQQQLPPVFHDVIGEEDEAEAAEFSSLADELRSRLKSRDQAPLLLPPKDYDTVHRSKGKLIQYENRKCLNKEIVGKSGVYKIANDDPADRNGATGQGSTDTGSKHSSEDDGITMILGHTNSPIASTVNNNNDPPLDNRIVYASTPRVPFSPGPVTAELKKRSYFPSKEDLPNYLQGSRNSLNRQEENGGRVSGPPSAGGGNKRFLRKQQSSPEFGQLPGYGRPQRHSSELDSYTSRGRNGDIAHAPHGYETSRSSAGSRHSDVNLSQTLPSADVMRRASRDGYSAPEGVVYVPTPDYTRGRRGAMLKRTRSGYY